MLKVENLSVSYVKRPIVEKLNMEVEQGKVVSILGPNGSGKSTILNAIARFIKFQEGVVYLEGKDISGIKLKKLAQKICMLSQINTSPEDFTVKDLIYYGRIPHKRWYEQKDEEDEEIISWAIDQTNLTGFEEKKVARLSGGERQRVWLALALAQKPKLLFLDEPTTYLDVCHQLEVLELVKRLNNDFKITIVMVLHDLVHAARYSDVAVVLKKGEIVAMGSPESVLTTELIRDVYNVEAYIAKDEKYGGLLICPLNTV